MFPKSHFIWLNQFQKAWFLPKLTHVKFKTCKTHVKSTWRCTLQWNISQGTWKLPCSSQANIWQGTCRTFPFTSRANLCKVHWNFYVPCNEPYGKYVEIPITCHMFRCNLTCKHLARYMEISMYFAMKHRASKVRGNFHVPCKVTYGKVHGNFHTLPHALSQPRIQTFG